MCSDPVINSEFSPRQKAYVYRVHMLSLLMLQSEKVLLPPCAEMQNSSLSSNAVSKTLMGREIVKQTEGSVNFKSLRGK